MVYFKNITETSYNNKKYTIIKIPYKSIIIPIILDTDIYNKIKDDKRCWNITNNGNVYTKIQDNNSNTIIYLHEIAYILKYGRNNYPLVHINKIPLDNRIENLMEDKKNKDIRKNLNKKSRTIKLKNIDVDKIPSFVWYMKDDGEHGERFQIKLGNINWKCTSCNELSLQYKLEETKKYLRQYKEQNNIDFLRNSMNSDLNINGIKLKKEFYDILKKINLIFDYSLDKNTDILLKEDLTGLNEIEKKLLQDFNINNKISTYERYLLLK
jgi:hypothetical protein